jgi:hypothetical protein
MSRDSRELGLMQLRRELSALYVLLGIAWCDGCETFHDAEPESDTWAQKPIGNADDPAAPVYYPPII